MGDIKTNITYSNNLNKYSTSTYNLSNNGSGSTTTGPQPEVIDFTYTSATTTTTTTTTTNNNNGVNTQVSGTTITTGPQNNDTTTTTTVGGIVTDVNKDEIHNLENTIFSLEYNATGAETYKLISIYENEDRYGMMLSAYEEMRAEKEKKLEKLKKELGKSASEYYDSMRDENGDIDYSANNPLDNDAKISQQIEQLNLDIANIDLAIQEINNNLTQFQYDKIRCMDEYNEFSLRYNNIRTRFKTEEHISSLFNSDKCNPLLVIELLENGDITESGFDRRKLSNMKNMYNYMTEDERKMYHYLYTTCSPDEANKYLSTLEDGINRKIGMINAQKKFESLNLDDPNVLDYIANVFGVTASGLEDGIDTFFEGLHNLVGADGKVSAEEYEKMFYLQMLNENTKLLPSLYKFGSTSGNMIPSIAASTLASMVATPAAGEMVGTILMGSSAGGNAMEQALQGGADSYKAILYGILSGASEATLEHFLGGIPGLSKETSSSIVTHMRKEGREELIQEIIDAVLQNKLLNQEVSMDDLLKNGFESYLMGALMGGMFTGVNNFVSNKVTVEVDGVEYNVSPDTIMEYLDTSDTIDSSSFKTYIENNLSQDSSISYDASEILSSDYDLVYEQLQLGDLDSKELINSLRNYYLDSNGNLTLEEQQKFNKIIKAAENTYHKTNDQIMDAALDQIKGRESDAKGCGKKCYFVEVDGKKYALLEHNNAQLETLQKRKSLTNELVLNGVDTPDIVGIKVIDGVCYELQEMADGKAFAPRTAKNVGTETYLNELNDTFDKMELLLDNDANIKSYFESSKILSEHKFSLDSKSDNLFIADDGKIIYLDIDEKRMVMGNDIVTYDATKIINGLPNILSYTNSQLDTLGLPADSVEVQQLNARKAELGKKYIEECCKYLKGLGMTDSQIAGAFKISSTASFFDSTETRNSVIKDVLGMSDADFNSAKYSPNSTGKKSSLFIDEDDFDD